MGDFDPLRVLAILSEHEVQYIVIGGIAATAHGSTSITGDLDICYARGPDNLKRLAAALQTLNARLRGVEENVPFKPDAQTLTAGDHFPLITDLGSLDCLGTPAGTNGYEDLNHQAHQVDLDGLKARVASLDDLIRMKRAAGPPKDRIELEILGALRDELRGRR